MDWGKCAMAPARPMRSFSRAALLARTRCNSTKFFRKIKQFGGHARQGGGVCAIEMALWDIAGKVYNAPVYAMVGGGKFRDKIRIYADTTESKDPKVYAQRMKERKEGMGLTWLKMDLGIEMVSDTPGTLTPPSDLSRGSRTSSSIHFLGNGGHRQRHCHAGAVCGGGAGRCRHGNSSIHGPPRASRREVHHSTGQGLREVQPVVDGRRDSMDVHRSAEAISDESPTPILTGEDIYLKEPFKVLCEKHAVSKIHPDLATSGGILETHKIGDMAEEYGVPMAMHFAGTPVSCMANVHCAAATQNFLALENHSLDVPWWSSLVQEYTKTPLVNHGWIEVPDRPGLGVTLNEDVVRQHLAPGTGYFEPTPEWDKERSWDRLWS